MNLRLTSFLPLIIMFPSIAIGAIAMNHYKIPAFIWAQNIVCLVLGGLISYLIVSNRFSMIKRNFNHASILIPVLLLILTFISPGIDGVHRWISIGILRFNVSMIVLPILIIELCKLSQIKDLKVTFAAAIAISILLLFQPDASQLTGFAIPMMIILCTKTDKKILQPFIIGIFSILVILSWVFLDNLPPVAYVEGILSLLADMGFLWLILGLLSLMILPVPFIFLPPRNFELPSICAGLYFIIIFIGTFFGNFPVPLMGYGISPIIGYFIAITWYAKSHNDLDRIK